MVKYTTGVWSRFSASLWYWILAAVVAYELWCYADGDDRTPPLTHVVVSEVPRLVILPVLAWLLVHFWVRYEGGNLFWPEVTALVVTFVYLLLTT